MLLEKIIIFALSLSLLCTQVFAKGESLVSDNDLKSVKIKKGQLVEITLRDEQKIIIKFIVKTDTDILGKLVKFDQGNYKTMSKEVRINYEEIISYKLLLKTSFKQAVMVAVIAGGIFMVVLIVFIGPSWGIPD